ncbi:OmpA family protein [Nocardiopsis lambiniae]|uniref:OmpA family protein n=1 Tax=Nocardiopsis lambiniae TaxID=3075539 RepID=A0ABU2M7B5_9ACTN|nr:OmpA family protein [Nocardiopsis sp. DSM 44743]MDT0328040.1 OmpA family protein [Nocardiopsis sp. DSM 44743]
MTSPPAIAPARAVAVCASVTASALLLTGCGIVLDLTGGRETPVVEEPTEEEVDPRPEPADLAFPYTREGQIFQDNGQDSTLRFAITGLERTDEYTVLYYENTYVDHFQGIVTNLSMPNTLIDPVSGRAFWEITDEEGYYYGSVAPTPDGYPVEVGATNRYRRYFPRLPDQIRQITFVGSGLGAMTGIPVVDVEEEQPDPENPNGPDLVVTGPAYGDIVEFENRRPDPGAEEWIGEQESFVDSDVASTTREGDTETVALKADVMFDFDSAELTDEAEEVVRSAARSVERNIDPADSEITVIGHTDGRGSDSYNEELSEERAETVRDVLEEELGSGYDFVVEGRGSEELIAEEGGSDDEEARARNRRVEFSYVVDRSDEGATSGRDEGLLGSSERHVFPPAGFVEDDTAEVVASATDDDVRLDVHPLRRDGAYVISTVSLTNTGDEPVLPDMGGGDAVIPGAPTEFSQGALGGFQLLEPDTDLVRYVTVLNFGGQSYTGFADEVHEMQPDNTYQLVAVFPAPPRDVETLTLRAGPFGEIEDVPFTE